jgi:hypothetical protein
MKKSSHDKIPPRRPASVRYKGQKGPKEELKSARIQFWTGVALFCVTGCAGLILLWQFTRPAKLVPKLPVFPTAIATPKISDDNSGMAASESLQDSQIVVRSDVIGAEVWMDGKFQGLTPQTINHPSPGSHSGFVRCLKPPAEKPFKVTVRDSTSERSDVFVSFNTGPQPSVVHPTAAATRNPSFQPKVEFPEKVRFGQPFYIKVERIPGLEIESGNLYILPKCKARSLNFEDTPPKQMYEYRDGLIREDLKTEWCKGPALDREKGAIFFIMLQTSQGKKMIGSPEVPFEIQFTP